MTLATTNRIDEYRVGAGKAAELVERADELAAIEHLVRTGTGVLVVEGPAGIGKSALVAAAADAGEQAGFDVVRARGSELEAGFGFGVVRQLFERRLAAASDEERDRLLRGAAALAAPVVDPVRTSPTATSDGGEAALAMAHGLYWVTANLAAERRLLLAVDDAHWADPASLRFLAYLAPRVHGLAIVLVVAIRTGEPAAHEPPLRAVTAAATVVRPRPLSAEGVRMVVQDVLGAPAERLARACSDAGFDAGRASDPLSRPHGHRPNERRAACLGCPRACGL